MLTGSLGNAQKIIQELQAFGAVTPFTSSELIETAKRLKAFGFETEEVVDVTKRLGDIAGATGADLSGIATAFGQIQAKGRLQGEELLQLQERGVDLQGTLRKEYDLTAEEFQKALSKGRIGADAVNFALVKLTEAGGKYADGAISQSDTLNGKFSTLQDSIDTLARTIGRVLSPVIKGDFDQAIQALGAVNRLLAAGRQGGFTRAIGGISSAITFGATTEGIDRAEKLLSQVSSQKNRAGIEQNIQVLTQLSNVLKRIPATDPNAGRLVPLQGRIMEMQSQNIEALQKLSTPKLSDIKIPKLGGGTVPKGDGARTAKERVDMSEKMLKLLQERIELSKGENKVAIALKENEMRMLEIQESSLLPREKIAAQLKAEEMLHNDLRGIHGENLQLFLDQKAAAESLGKTVAEDYLKRLGEAAGPINQLYASIGQSIETGIVDALSAAVEGTKSLADVASQTLRQVGSILLQFGVNTALGGIPGFGQFFGGARANGGTVGGGRSYLVGEKGPELFTPGRSGSIAPSGSFGETNVVVNVDASGSQAQGNQPNAKALGAAIGAAVQAELVKQKRPGGLLS